MSFAAPASLLNDFIGVQTPTVDASAPAQDAGQNLGDAAGAPPPPHYYTATAAAYPFTAIPGPPHCAWHVYTHDLVNRIHMGNIWTAQLVSQLIKDTITRLEAIEAAQQAIALEAEQRSDTVAESVYEVQTTVEEVHEQALLANNGLTAQLANLATAIVAVRADLATTRSDLHVQRMHFSEFAGAIKDSTDAEIPAWESVFDISESVKKLRRELSDVSDLVTSTFAVVSRDSDFPSSPGTPSTFPPSPNPSAGIALGDLEHRINGDYGAYEDDTDDDLEFPESA